MTDYDAIIIGSGHNGLTCGCYLAKAGLRVCIVERRNIIGGAAVTEELWPGIKISRASYVPGVMDKIIKDLELVKHGLSLKPVDPQNFAPFPSGKHLFTYLSDEKTAKSMEKFSKNDAREFPRFSEYLRNFAETVEPLLLAPPPSLNDLTSFFEGSDFEDVVREILMTSAADLLNEHFESEEVKGALVMNGVLNTSMGPDTVGTSYIMAMALGKRGYHCAIGGTGAVTKALASYFRAHGGTVITDAEVKNIIIEGGKATGIELKTGKKLTSKIVVSNADPKTTFLKLVGEDHLEDDFVRKTESLRAYGTSFKINLVLNSHLNFKALPSAVVADQQRALTDINPSIDYGQKAYDDSRWGRIPEEPPLSIFSQTAWDDTMVPAGLHTLSIISKYNPYVLREGKWEDLKPIALERALNVLEDYCPGVRKSITHIDALSPLDLEKTFGFTEGNVTHLDQTMNQMLSFRPLVGWAHYRTPINSLYICGAGTHPGGGVKGAPGHNAAQIILEDLKIKA
ncbi:MAG: NAD(P)/FAD-dependent oxidoreductase [Thermoplasmata archaeon YP2-bin.285]|uniref:NAD(P)/FAD-dependent oxidoreductase n=1 Tax=Candidatus Sysuiplasma superficiale TaxID=2823368 RepID=A0A8J7YTY9_9ARCH|nr:NAD(P)/FAD-dependent oxidoreductase [Candidatus Sysuiplasma superficiale]